MQETQKYQRKYQGTTTDCKSACCTMENPIKPHVFLKETDHRYRWLTNQVKYLNWTTVTYKKAPKRYAKKRTQNGFDPNLNGLDSI